MTELVLQTYIDGAWHNAAQLAIADDAAGHRSTSELGYEVGYWVMNTVDDEVLIDDRALSVAAPLQLAPRKFKRWPAFLLDMLPQGDARNVLGVELGFKPDSEEVELPLLMRAGSAPIGNVRVMEAHEANQARQGASDIVALSLGDIAKRRESFFDIARRYALLASGSSGIQGVWPKLMLTERADGMLMPDSELLDEQARRHFIVKTVARRPETHDVDILSSEPGYIEVARQFGLRCGEPLRLLTDNVLMIPRFDRAVTKAGVVRYGQESIVAAAGIAEFAYATTHETYLDVIKRVCTNPEVEVIEYLRRDILAVAMGDPDNHGRNTALRKQRGLVELTPVFDFAPMRLKEDVYRSTRWHCAPKPVPDARGIIDICNVVAEGTRLTRDEVMTSLRDMVPMLRDLPDIARQHDVASVAIDRAIINGDALAAAIEGA